MKNLLNAMSLCLCLSSASTAMTMNDLKLEVADVAERLARDIHDVFKAKVGARYVELGYDEEFVECLFRSIHDLDQKVEDIGKLWKGVQEQCSDEDALVLHNWMHHYVPRWSGILKTALSKPFPNMSDDQFAEMAVSVVSAARQALAASGHMETYHQAMLAKEYDKAFVAISEGLAANKKDLERTWSGVLMFGAGWYEQVLEPALGREIEVAIAQLTGEHGLSQACRDAREENSGEL